MNILAELVCSKVRAELFRLLFGFDAEELHLREIQRRTAFAIATVRQDIEKLEKTGIVNRRRDGNRVYFRANSQHPLYPEIRQLVMKTTGVSDVLRSCLQAADIRVAFVFGSMASGTARPGSDIDLMVIGDIGLRKLSSLLMEASQHLGREINPHILSDIEFRRRVGQRDHFLESVLRSDKIFVIGSAHDLETVG